MRNRRVTPEVQRALRLFKQFRETDPTRIVDHSRFVESLPEFAIAMGRVDFIGYRTTHAGRMVPYEHHFNPGSKPMLLAGPGRNGLLLIGGRYHVTDRGIVDLDASGDELPDYTD